MKHIDSILILDFGSQSTQLLARRIRELNVFSEILPWDVSIEKIISLNPKGIIFSGEPSSVLEENTPSISEKLLKAQIPVLVHTEDGAKVISNFLFKTCNCKPDWDLNSWLDDKIKSITEKISSGHVICGLSGGVDSSVSASIVSRAVGEANNLDCIFVNHGLLRLGEAEQVLKDYESMNLRVHYVDASDRFLEALSGVSEPERKRKIIGETFIRVFEDEAKKICGSDNTDKNWLLQGTVYPDVIESGQKGKDNTVIKSHHNVGGLPENMNFQLLEPLRDLFKDEVRKIGRILGVPESIIKRHPFPGPGLAVRCLGEITKERLDVLRKADAIFIEEIKKANLYDSTWQAFCALLPVKSVGISGGMRVYGEVIVLRAIETTDAMTADWFRFPHEILDISAKRICNEVAEVSRVVYDVTSKPPATIEWE